MKLDSKWYNEWLNDWLDYAEDYYYEDLLDNLKTDFLENNRLFVDDSLWLSITDLRERVNKCLHECFAYKSFRLGQEEIIFSCLQGRDSLVLLSTGYGKSLCYQIPALCMPGLCVVISPLISLMIDQVQQLINNGIKAAYIANSLSIKEINNIMFDAVNGNLKFLYIAPERLNYSFSNQLKSLNINLIVVDEAHCVSTWGHDFRDSYLKISNIRNYTTAPLMALTATAIEETRYDIKNSLNLRDPFEYIGNFDRENIFYQLQYIESNKRYDEIGKILSVENNLPAIIYVNSRAGVDSLRSFLVKKDFSVGAYHAGMSDMDREDTQNKFILDQIDIVVATVAFGMGINKSNVRTVIHYDVSRSIEAYYQETGRAGRDGLPSKAIMFYNESLLENIRRMIYDDEDISNNKISKFEEIVAFTNAEYCRRQALLHYFSQPYHKKCNNCDQCLKPKTLYDATIDSQKILSVIYRSKSMINIDVLIDILIGSHNEHIIDNNYDNLTCFAVGKDKHPLFWRNITQQLIHRGVIGKSIISDNLNLLEPSIDLLKGFSSIELVKPSTYMLSSVNFDIPVINRKLYDNLIRLRRVLADTLNIRSDLIMNDPMIKNIVIMLPQSHEDLLEIEGMTEVRISKYGHYIINMVKKYGVSTSRRKVVHN